MTDHEFFERHLGAHPIMAIFRGLTPDRTVELCEAAWAAGVQLVEVPVQDRAAEPALAAAVAAAADRARPVGAGTILTIDQLRRVRRLGARFIVSPGLDAALVQESRRLNMPVLPGVATATEIAHALSHGLSWLKAFPAAQLTPPWITAQLAPFPQANFVATGGVDPDNAAAFLDAGCRAVAVGKAFADPGQIQLLYERLGCA